MGKPNHILSTLFNNDNSSGVALKNKILKGNERVLTARLTDAKFFWEKKSNSL